MMTLIERLRGFPSGLDCADAADLLESQAARIAELETAYESASTRATLWHEHYTALRKRIDEAPVVAWWYPKAGKAIADGRLYWDDRKEMMEAGTKLISKEDLQK